MVNVFPNLFVQHRTDVFSFFDAVADKGGRNFYNRGINFSDIRVADQFFRNKIGRASCRERVEISVVVGSIDKKQAGNERSDDWRELVQQIECRIMREDGGSAS